MGIVTYWSVYALSKDVKIKNWCGSEKACLQSEAANLQPLYNSLILMEASQKHLREKMVV